MSYQLTAQFDALPGAPLNLAQTNLSNVSGAALLPGADMPLVEGEDYTADLVAGTVTLLREVPGSHVFFRFEHNNAPPPMPTDPDLILLREVRAIVKRTNTRLTDAQAIVTALGAATNAAERNVQLMNLAQLHVATLNILKDVEVAFGQWVNRRGKDEAETP